jgi:hypothetical protein
MNLLIPLLIAACLGFTMPISQDLSPWFWQAVSILVVVGVVRVALAVQSRSENAKVPNRHKSHDDDREQSADLYSKIVGAPDHPHLQAFMFNSPSKPKSEQFWCPANNVPQAWP